MANNYNVWTKWHPLKKVMLGNTFSHSFYKDIKNTSIKDSLYEIVDQTLEELDFFDYTLKSHGIEVLRPQIDPNENILDYMNDQGGMDKLVPVNPICVRDHQVVIGNTLYLTNLDDHIHISQRKSLYEYNKKDVKMLMPLHENTSFFDLLIYSQSQAAIIFAPHYNIIGKDIFIDTSCTPDLKLNFKHLMDILPNFRIHQVKAGGHGDGQFMPLAYNKLITRMPIDLYKSTFETWDMFQIKKQRNDIEKFLNLKSKINFSWFPEKENNTNIEYYLNNYLFNYQEKIKTEVFEVNVLPIDDKNVLVSNYDKDVFDFLKINNIEPTIIPWSNRFFWSGGLHCCTLDLYREGVQEDYFPYRTEMSYVHEYDNPIPYIIT